jgi:hypothetical protein
VWLLGRADEVRAVVGGVLQEWHDGRLDAARATDILRAYVDGLRSSVEGLRPDARQPSSPSLRPQHDTLVSIDSPGAPPTEWADARRSREITLINIPVVEG